MRLEHFFSESNIIRKLCALRVKLASRTHNKNFEIDIADASEANELSDSDRELLAIFPPRKLWNKFRLQSRSGNTLNDNAVALKVATLTLRKDPNHRNSEWNQRLGALISRIRQRALSNNPITFNCSNIRMHAKDQSRWRPIVIFDLEDKIIEGTFAEYIRFFCERHFVPQSFAFRIGLDGKKTPDHNSAFLSVVNYTQSLPSAQKWVAECDIQAFFDSVAHSVIRESILRVTASVSSLDSSMAFDPRAFYAIDAYLNSYSFNRSILQTALPAQRARSPQDAHRICKWPAADLAKYHRDTENENIGLPQGGSLSAVLSNIVLDKADRAVLSIDDSRLYYARYCDDIIIIHPEKQPCADALERYTQALHSLKLPLHVPKEISGYGKRFWEEKSKKPFCWTDDKSIKNRVPWISFVGYHLHVSGTVRIRPSSIAKEMQKQAGVPLRIRHIIKAAKKNGNPIKCSHKAVMHRIRMRLIAMSVGKRKIYDLPGKRYAMCWSYGFSALAARKHDKMQLQLLDYARERTIARFSKKIAKEMENATIAQPNSAPREKTHRYYGYPFSYRAQFDIPGRPRILSALAAAFATPAEPAEGQGPPEIANKT